MEVNVPHTCSGTIYDRVRRKAELIARSEAKKQGVKVGLDDWRKFEPKVLYSMIDPGADPSDNKFSPSDLSE